MSLFSVTNVLITQVRFNIRFNVISNTGSLFDCWVYHRLGHTAMTTMLCIESAVTGVSAVRDGEGNVVSCNNTNLTATKITNICAPVAFLGLLLTDDKPHLLSNS